jgi:predicted nucleotide-binding protein
MSTELNRLIEVRVVDDQGRRIEGGILNVLANDAAFAVIQMSKERDALIQVIDHDLVISLVLEYAGKVVDSIKLAQNQNYWTFKLLPASVPCKIFIGCSVEGLEEAMILQQGLAHSADAAIWSQGVFDLGRGKLETLVSKAPDFTHAILILTPDDMLIKRTQEVPSARDNVLFELGLFIGVLGRDRTFLVNEKSVRLPTDLAGITTATFERGKGVNPDANMGPVISMLLRAMGLRRRL